MSDRYTFDIEQLNKIKEDKMYRNFEIMELLKVGAYWLPYCVTNFGLPYQETDARGGRGIRRRLYNGKDIINCILQNYPVTEKLSQPKHDAPAKPLIWDIKSGFICSRNGKGIGFQTPGSSIEFYSSKASAMWEAAKRIWRL